MRDETVFHAAMASGDSPERRRPSCSRQAHPSYVARGFCFLSLASLVASSPLLFWQSLPVLLLNCFGRLTYLRTACDTCFQVLCCLFSCFSPGSTCFPRMFYPVFMTRGQRCSIGSSTDRPTYQSTNQSKISIICRRWFHISGRKRVALELPRCQHSKAYLSSLYFISLAMSGMDAGFFAEGDF